MPRGNNLCEDINIDVDSTSGVDGDLSQCLRESDSDRVTLVGT
jgi:hypothetical protein